MGEALTDGKSMLTKSASVGVDFVVVIAFVYLNSISYPESMA